MRARQAAGSRGNEGERGQQGEDGERDGEAGPVQHRGVPFRIGVPAPRQPHASVNHRSAPVPGHTLLDGRPLDQEHVDPGRDVECARALTPTTPRSNKPTRTCGKLLHTL
jgi:hypothetical protein